MPLSKRETATGRGDCPDNRITDVETVADAVASFRAGATDYINKRLIRGLLIPKIKVLIGGDNGNHFSLLSPRKSDGYLRAYSAVHILAPLKPECIDYYYCPLNRNKVSGQ